MTVWTTPAEVERKLRRRWESGRFLTGYGEGSPWEPLPLSLHGPAVGELASDLGRVQSWAKSWERAATRFSRLEYRRVGGRLIGANELPTKVWIDSYEQLWSVLGVEWEAARFADLVAETRSRAPRIVEWMLRHPLRLLELAPEWSAIVDVVLWIDAHAERTLYLRQVDVPGVDTKFIEHHRGVLADLLERQLDERRIDSSRPKTDFAARYGFRKRPAYVRLRALGPNRRLAGGYSELAVRIEELSMTPPECSVVCVIENEITYLAFPPLNDAVALWGGGYAVSSLEQLSWIANHELIYWGDIDTHGFAILNRMRHSFPRAKSMLMDRTTLLAHEGQWVQESQQHIAHLDLLQPAEAELYSELVEDTFGSSVRLEQERISYSAIEHAIRLTRTEPRL